jgi:diguanylate cyclase (GGDEF)-like protein
MRRVLRGNEPLYRFGGEEFLWLMQCRSAAEAGLSAQRLVTSIRGTPVPTADARTIRVTATLGLARAGEEEELDDVLERADHALYEGKRAGRDRYVIAGEEH